MAKFRLSNLLAFLLIVIFIISMSRHFHVFSFPTYLVWTTYFITFICAFRFASKFHDISKFDKRIFVLYLLIVLFGIIRGMYLDGLSYWHYRALVLNSFKLFVPIFAVVFSNIFFTKMFLKKYLRYGILFFPLFIFFVDRRIWGSYLMPFSILLLLIPLIRNKKSKAIILLFSFIATFADFDSRSVVIKFFIAFLLLMIVIMGYRFNVKTRVYKYFWILYISPFIFVFLGGVGIFNVFNFKDYINFDLEIKSTTEERGEVDSDLLVDTRTFIYFEVVSSAIINEYILWGRTPARGNDSEYVDTFEDYEEMKVSERFANEVSILNLFTWLGVVGVISYSIIFVRASYLAIYRSNNLIVALIGAFVAFRWFYSWVEEINDFDASYVSLFILIGLCYSKTMRALTDEELKLIWSKL